MIQAGNFGYVLTLQSGLDLSTATAVNLVIKAPLQVPVSKSLPLPASVIDGPSGQIGYQVSQGDFPAPGVYQLQVVDVSPGRQVASRVATLVVEPNVS